MISRSQPQFQRPRGSGAPLAPIRDARELTLALGGRWHGSSGLACCPAHDDRNPSLSLRSGNDGRVLVYCHAGCDFRDVRAALGEGGLWPIRDDRKRSPQRPRCYRPPKPTRPRSPAIELEQGLHAQEPQDRWDRSMPIEPACAAGLYLRGRSCPLPPPDGHVRWLAGVPHPDGPVFPAILALVTDAVTGAPLTLHTTWIAKDGSSKADVRTPRRYWPKLERTGGVVRLWPDDEVTMGLAVAEGLETALSLAREFGPATWSCLDAQGLASLPVLPGVEALTIAVDHDRRNPKTGKRAGAEAAETLARRWHEAGREVFWWRSPIEGDDYNDFAHATLP